MQLARRHQPAAPAVSPRSACTRRPSTRRISSRSGLPQEAAVLETLARFGYAAPGSPVFIQSFDPNNLKQFRGMTRLPLVQLLEHEVEDIAGVARYADAIGMAKSLATPETVAAAHEAGMAVHVWTFRAENEFLPDDLKSGTDPAAHGDLPAEIERYLARGIDGFFVDFPAIGVLVRNRFADRSREAFPRKRS